MTVLVIDLDGDLCVAAWDDRVALLGAGVASRGAEAVGRAVVAIEDALTAEG